MTATVAPTRQNHHSKHSSMLDLTKSADTARPNQLEFFKAYAQNTWRFQHNSACCLYHGGTKAQYHVALRRFLFHDPSLSQLRHTPKPRGKSHALNAMHACICIYVPGEDVNDMYVYMCACMHVCIHLYMNVHTISICRHVYLHIYID